MTTLPEHSFSTDNLEREPIPVGTIEYFRSRLQSKLHQLVLDEYIRREDEGLNQAVLARRIHKKPEVVNRLLGSPGNWTVNTVSDLLLGMGAEPELGIVYLDDILANRTEKWGDDDTDISLEHLEQMPIEPSPADDG